MTQLTCESYEPTIATRSHARPVRLRGGLSLLEVVLALAILAMTAALLVQISKQATDNGMMAQRLATAQILCESVMSEVLVGSISTTGTSWTPVNQSVPRGTWYYRVETLSSGGTGMVGIKVAVSDDPYTTNGSPDVFFVVRWMIDPTLGLDRPPQTSTTGTGTGTSGSSGSSAAGGIQ